MSQEPSHKVRTNRERWIAAAYDVLRTEGIDAVNVVNLAQRLEVSRGPFYYAFRDLQDLHDALLDLYLEDLTERLSREAESASRVPHERLVYFVTQLLDPAAVQVDRQVRQWGLRDPRVMGRLLEMDARRCDILCRYFQDMGFDWQESIRRARMGYYEHVGHMLYGNLVKATAADLAYRYLLLTTPVRTVNAIDRDLIKYLESKRAAAGSPDADAN
jgi:AcrR family transcriptional regulator